jgi:type I restriction enzyme M protein
MDLIAEGLAKKLIRFEDDRKYVVYVDQAKRRRYDAPEEKVQVETYLKLVLRYKYPVERIRCYVPVQMGADKREADIIVYADDKRQSPLIVVECKAADISELEFLRARDQASSYAVAEGARYLWTTTGLKDAYHEIPKGKPKGLVSIPDIPQCGVTKLASHKFAKGGGKSPEGQQLFDLVTVTEDELTRRFKLAHQALWGGGELNPSEAFDELDKLIFCKIWDERKARKKGEPYDFQIITVSTPEAEVSEEAKKKDEEQTSLNLLNRIRALYAEGRKKDPEVFKDEIRLSASKTRTVVSYLESINLSATDLDSKGRAFETFLGSFFRGDFGQYFTPRPIVKFIVDVLPITHETRVLDTSCGSGGFLLHALDKVRHQADDFHADDPVKHYKHWHDFAQFQLFGIEINEQIARTAKMNMIIHDDGHTNVVAADGLLPPADIVKKTGNPGFTESAFDIILTNPPFGSSVRQTEQAYFKNYRLTKRLANWLDPKTKDADRPAQDTEVLFLEQCHTYLRAGGYLAIVIPDGILTNSSLDYVRDKLEELYRIVAVVSLPQTAFQVTDAGVKSSVLFLKKWRTAEGEKIAATKRRLRDTLVQQQKLAATLDALDAEKKKTLKNLVGFTPPDGLLLDDPALKETPAYQAWAKSVSEAHSAKVDALREQLSEAYEAQKREALNDYPVFMAIAEDIGYDATGRETKTNELEPIAKELARFIQDIEAEDAA